MAAPLRVFVVDDTVVYRKILGDLVGSFPDTELVGAAPSGKIALQKLERMEADLVLLDLEMPEMNGVETYEQMQRKFPNVSVAIVSALNPNDAKLAVQALQMGALDYVAKPQTSSFKESAEAIKADLARAIQLARQRAAKSEGRTAAAPARAVGPQPAKPVARAAGRKVSDTFAALAIGVSTGGPQALTQVVPKLPAGMGAPILIVQHMPPVFTANLADRLDKLSPFPVAEAVDGEPFLPGHAYIAPGGRHLLASRGPDGALRAKLDDGPPENSCRPAVDVLFRSLSKLGGPPTLCAILTGMGDDGAKGATQIVDNGGWCVCQDAATCVVYGMPKAAVDCGAACESLPLTEIPGRLQSLLARTKADMAAHI